VQTRPYYNRGGLRLQARAGVGEAVEHWGKWVRPRPRQTLRVCGNPKGLPDAGDPGYRTGWREGYGLNFGQRVNNEKTDLNLC